MNPDLYDQLVARPHDADTIAAALSRTDPQSRAEALHVAQRLAEEFIQPARRWISRSPDDPTHTFINLDLAAGTSIPGLLAGLLRRRLPQLAPAPSTEALASAMEAAGVEIRSDKQRADFFQAWIAHRAAQVVRALLHVVEEDLPHSPAANVAELASLRRLAAQPLPAIEQMLIASILQRRTL